MLLVRAWSPRRRCAGRAERPRRSASGASAAAQRGQRGSNRPASRSAARRGRGRTGAMRRAAVAAFAVDDHARRQHEPPAEAPARERAQEHRGAEVVVRHVVRHVERSRRPARPSRPDGRLVDAVERALDRIGVADVALPVRASSTRTSWPAARSASTTCEPTNPAPPVDQHEHDVSLRAPAPARAHQGAFSES